MCNNSLHTCMSLQFHPEKYDLISSSRPRLKVEQFLVRPQSIITRPSGLWLWSTQEFGWRHDYHAHVSTGLWSCSSPAYLHWAMDSNMALIKPFGRYTWDSKPLVASNIQIESDILVWPLWVSCLDWCPTPLHPERSASMPQRALHAVPPAPSLTLHLIIFPCRNL